VKGTIKSLDQQGHGIIQADDDSKFPDKPFAEKIFHEADD
jgi:hypothetical protein